MLPVQINEAMWAIIEPLLPAHDLRRGGRPRVYGNRPVLDAIFYVLRSGCQWRMIPHDLVYDAVNRGWIGFARLRGCAGRWRGCRCHGRPMAG